MKNGVKILTIILLTLVCTSCSSLNEKENSEEINLNLSPEETVETVFKALAGGEGRKANLYLREVDDIKNGSGVVVKGNKLFGDSIDEEDNEETKNFYSTLKFSDFTILEENDKYIKAELDISLNGNRKRSVLTLVKDSGHWEILMDKNFFSALVDVSGWLKDILKDEFKF